MIGKIYLMIFAFALFFTACSSSKSAANDEDPCVDRCGMVNGVACGPCGYGHTCNTAQYCVEIPPYDPNAADDTATTDDVETEAFPDDADIVVPEKDGPELADDTLAPDDADPIMDDPPVPDEDYDMHRITKQWGTPAHDGSGGVAADGAGNIFVTGYTAGSLEGNSNAGDDDVFLIKLNADGTMAWIKQWGTGSRDQGHAVAVNGLGDIFVAGHTGGALEGNLHIGNYDLFLTKWNADGTMAWTRQWGTEVEDRGNAAALDGAGNIFVTGTTFGVLGEDTNEDSNAIFLTKWNADGTMAWSRQWGGDGNDEGSSVATDGEGNIFVTGYTDGSLDGNTNATPPPARVRDAFLTRWNADGTKAWTKQWGTSSWESGRSVATDGAGNIYVAGFIYGESLDGNAMVGLWDIFLTKWSVNGEKVWTRQWGTVLLDDAGSVALNKAGDIFVSGLAMGEFYEDAQVGEGDIFLTKWNADGTGAWTRQWGTTSVDSGSSVAVDGAGRILVTGYTAGSLAEINAGENDIFLSIVTEN